MSDLEVVALSLTAEFMSIDSENSLFKEPDKQEIPNLI
ncbi:TPA: IS982 family transposase, partial [Flavobacterium psychrophilum]